jgi:hypothetical protein
VFTSRRRYSYNGQLVPPAPGANAIRSFRLGLVDSGTSAFETFGMASIYIEGIYELQSQRLGLAAFSATKGPVTSIVLAEVPIVAGDWYRLDASFTKMGADQIQITGFF